MFRFRRLQTKLGVLYGALFGVLLTLLGAAAYTTISGNVERAIQGELAANGAVFDRVWALRSAQLQDGAELLARDFGFRAAVATHDAATIRSALDNLRDRLDLDRAFIVDLDASVVGMDAARLDDGVDDLWSALDRGGGGGVLMIDGRPYQAISAPVEAPALAGWVVFAIELDRGEFAALEDLSSAELRGALLTRRGDGPWRLHGAAKVGPGDGETLSRFAGQARRGDVGARRLRLSDGPAVSLVRPLKSMDSGRQAALSLTYPLNAALAPYRPMLVTVAVLGVVSLVALIVGSGLLARSVTRPIAALDQAARRLARGDDAQVDVVSADEIGGLAQSFNTMAAAIGERERRITHLALHDGETELPNRRALTADLEALTRNGPAGGQVAVAVLGLERFALVRSAIGYGLASELLRSLAAKIVARHPQLTPARLSTSTLALAFQAPSAAAAERLVTDLVAELSGAVNLRGATVDVGLSAGLSLFGVHADTPAILVERANIAMDQAFETRRRVALFDEAAYGDPVANLTLMSEMLEAAAADVLELHYQPKLDLRSGRVCGMEALVRWSHGQRGMISPDLFVSMAEDTGHIRVLTDWVLERAIRDQAALRVDGIRLPVSVNISGRLAGDRGFAEMAIGRVAESGADLCFEITETAVIDNPDDAMELIQAYSRAGVPISIDDYGSGLSSLAYLKQIAANELKIDKAFILTLAAGRREALIVKSTIDLAHAMGLKVVAEGVETAECIALLQSMGCDVAQGYHVARPMGLEALRAWLADPHVAQAPVARRGRAAAS